ncbi:sliding clamp DNA polymerase accessory protein,phage associated [Yersinia phage phiR1-RT]|uniref:Sliding clamp n=1 Tax=Yersinia phage phiR1-RT TaxID=1206558 RepID=I7J3W5_BPPR1|nr:DNA polymerase processivity factor [Yersinia phage phiR1-RT]CCI88633.1 sliding clamp DNA polymerase accessory protein,phage associated [Yersinia phage phiR1-RT]
MKLSKETISILKNFSSINSGLMLKKGSFVMTRAVNGTSYADATISDEIDFDVAIYDLPAFLSVLSLVGENAEITHDSKMANIEIRNGRSTINWASADPSSIKFPPSAVKFPLAHVIFELPGEELKQLLRVSRGMGIDTLGITNNEGKIVINGYNKVSDSSCSKILYSLEAGEYDGEHQFNILINMSNLKIVDGDYKVMIWGKIKGTEKQAALRFEGSQVNYVIAVESDSTYDFV